MDQRNNFHELIHKCISGAPESIEILNFNIATLIKQWSRKNMYEIDWIADENGLIKNEGFLLNCCDACFIEINDKKHSLWTYSEFKKMVLRIAEKIMETAFQLFLKFLKNGSNKAWTIARKILYVRTYGWMKKRGINNDYQIKVLFSESMERFYEAYTKKDLTFGNASGLKSYFFRIAELRMLEYHRENKKHSFLDLEDSPTKNLAFEDDIISDIEKEEDSKKVRNAIRKLSETEQSIIIGHYYEKNSLRDIAQELNKSEENIRVIKHRTLKKLMAILN